jgi:hypothetical protein
MVQLRPSMRIVRALALAGVMAMVPTYVWAWGCEGHRTIARIAARHLSTHARQQVRALLVANPIDSRLRRFCQPIDPDPFVDAATWADDVRDVQHTGAWHFLDIPRGARRDQASAACPKKSGCITTALAAQIQLLQLHAPSVKRADALRYVIHLVGDLHQPLHCTTNDDRGGNCVPVQYFSTAPALQKDRDGNPIKGDYKPTLHGLWDSSILATGLKARSIRLSQLAPNLDKRFAAQIPAWMAADVALEDWAWDSHELAERLAYGKLPKAIPDVPDTRPTTCDQANHVAARMLALHLRVDQTYQDAAVPAIDEQLAKAGVRLAKILNRVWP